MYYKQVKSGTFVSRPNRFIAEVEVDGRIETVHVKNTGRCREILVPGATVVLAGPFEGRKTSYDLIAAYKGDLLINIDSQAPNRAFGEYILESGFFGDHPTVHPEHTHGDSRFDFYIESGKRRIFVEVKGVTLECDGRCRFPDAPTERGRKHVRGLMECVREGYEAYAAFVVQMPHMGSFAPNYATDPEFGEELEEAEKAGVGILVLGCDVGVDSMRISYAIPHDFGHRSELPRLQQVVVYQEERHHEAHHDQRRDPLEVEVIRQRGRPYGQAGMCEREAVQYALEDGVQGGHREERAAEEGHRQDDQAVEGGHALMGFRQHRGHQPKHGERHA